MNFEKITGGDYAVTSVWTPKNHVTPNHLAGTIEKFRNGFYFQTECQFAALSVSDLKEISNKLEELNLTFEKNCVTLSEIKEN